MVDSTKREDKMVYGNPHRISIPDLGGSTYARKQIQKLQQTIEPTAKMKFKRTIMSEMASKYSMNDSKAEM